MGLGVAGHMAWADNGHMHQWRDNGAPPLAHQAGVQGVHAAQVLNHGLQQKLSIASTWCERCVLERKGGCVCACAQRMCRIPAQENKCGTCTRSMYLINCLTGNMC